ncbi:unnamed protein product [Aphanomyces euteiches]
MERFQNNLRTALDVVDGALIELHQLRGAVDIVVQRMGLFEQALMAKRDTLIAMETDLATIPEREIVTGDIENQPDVDHDFSLQDME